mmetsp:Transcript_34838/g.74260  ORF Transcript_34838/g.74260 Transcript_34838/m.74260 type:complete len:102 (+) Transcript_34838:330-635(+)
MILPPPFDRNTIRTTSLDHTTMSMATLFHKGITIAKTHPETFSNVVVGAALDGVLSGKQMEATIIFVEVVVDCVERDAPIAVEPVLAAAVQCDTPIAAQSR